MAHSAALVEVLKRQLKARSITYAQVAAAVGLSEASVKRMFSRRNFTLERLDQICQLAGIEFTDLTRLLASDEHRIAQLTLEQEREIIGNPKLFIVAVCALNHWTFEQIVDCYDISAADCVKLLMRLDRLKFIELMPGNRIKLLVGRTFSWLPEGPIQQFFREQAAKEYFRSRFDGPGELLLFVNGMLSRTSGNLILKRLRKLANEFSELHSEDMHLPFDQRFATSLLVAVRPWEMQVFRDLHRRSRPAVGAAVAQSTE